MMWPNICKRPLCALILFCGCLLFGLGVCPAHAQGTFVSIDAPGAGTGQGQGTFPLAINRSGVIVGYFTDSSGMEHGFIRAADGTFTIVDDPPGSAGTWITAINSLGLVAGFNNYVAGDTGFLRYRSGAFGALFIPGATYAQPIAMNDRGEVAGVASLYLGAVRGFVWSPGHSYTFTVPGAGSWVSVKGLNSSGAVTGSYDDKFDQRTIHGFVRDSAGNAVSFDAIDSTKYTYAIAINAGGQVAGYYLDSSDDEVQSFVRNADGTIALLALGGYQLQAAGMNDDGLIVGTAYTAASASAFESDAAGNVNLLVLPFSNIGYDAVGINKNGLLFGVYYDAASVSHGWLMIP